MIETAESDGVATVTIDRTNRRNALTPDGLDALAAAIETVETPVAYLHGAGSAFCAGADFDVVAGLDSVAAAEEFAERGQRVARTIASADAVVVAGIDGPARGGGVELALACDLRVATPRATFGEPGVQLGLLGAWGGTVRLSEVLRFGDAMDLALSGRVVDAAEAHRIGLVSHVVEEPFEVARELAANDPTALAEIKALMRDDRPREEREAAEAAAFARLAPGFDGVETDTGR